MSGIHSQEYYAGEPLIQLIHLYGVQYPWRCPGKSRVIHSHDKMSCRGIKAIYEHGSIISADWLSRMHFPGSFFASYKITPVDMKYSLRRHYATLLKFGSLWIESFKSGLLILTYNTQHERTCRDNDLGKWSIHVLKAKIR